MGQTAEAKTTKFGVLALKSFLILLLIINISHALFYAYYRVTVKEGLNVFSDGYTYVHPASVLYFIAVILCHLTMIYFIIRMLKWDRHAVFSYVGIGILRFVISIAEGGDSDGMIWHLSKTNPIGLNKGVLSIDNIWNLFSIVLLIFIILPSWKYFREIKPTSEVLLPLKNDEQQKVPKDISVILFILSFIILAFTLNSLYDLISFYVSGTQTLLSHLPSGYFIFRLVGIILYGFSILFIYRILKKKKYAIYGFAIAIIFRPIIEMILLGSVVYVPIAILLSLETALGLVLVAIVSLIYLQYLHYPTVKDNSTSIVRE